MQPKSVICEYLADLMGEPVDGKPLDQNVAERICPAEPTTSAHTPEECRTHTSGKYAADQIIEQESTPATTALSGIPDWAVNPFQVLMIRVHGVNLAVPLDRLDTIARWNGESTPIPGQPRWQIGLFLHERKKVSLVNLSRLIMPERQMTDSPPPGYLLLIGGARWGVVCDSIQRPRLLRAEEVRWSRNRQIRPWSHGIVVESLSVLLNIDALLAAIGTNNA